VSDDEFQEVNLAEEAEFKREDTPNLAKRVLRRSNFVREKVIKNAKLMKGEGRLAF